MPEISVWPVSSLAGDRKVGSSSARRPSAIDIFSWSALVFGSMATDDRLGEGDRLELIGASGAAERVAGDDLLDADGRRDVARVDLVDVLAVVGVHHQDAPDALGAAGRRR